MDKARQNQLKIYLLVLVCVHILSKVICIDVVDSELETKEFFSNVEKVHGVLR